MVLLHYYCARHNCVNSLQRNQPADYKSATGTVCHGPDLLSCEISLPIYALIWRMNYCSSLSLRFRMAISESPYFILACTDVGRLKNINGQISGSGMLVFHQLIFMVNLS